MTSSDRLMKVQFASCVYGDICKLELLVQIKQKKRYGRGLGPLEV